MIFMAKRPTPTAIKRLTGNPGRRPLNDAEPTMPVAEPPMPKGMTTPARREWKRIVPLLMTLGVLTFADSAALESYCESYAEMQQARKLIQKEGLVISTAQGQKPHPAVTIRDKAEKRMKSFLIEFGLTPASRSRIQLPKQQSEAGKPENALKAFLIQKQRA